MGLKKNILIIGVNGQDGSILSSLYINNGYNVIGTVRSERSNLLRLDYLNIKNKITLEILNPIIEADVNSIIIKYNPEVIYPLGSLTSVGQSFNNPKETLESNIFLIQNICESVRSFNKSIKIFNPLSSEMYGVQEGSIDISKIPTPLSPYGIAKNTCFELGKFYSSQYDLRIYNVVLFNHESELRSRNFVTRKIIESAISIRKGITNSLELGNINISRDWGCAFEYCDYIMRIMKLDNKCSLILGTGETNSLKDFVQHSFEINGLNFENHLKINRHFIRDTDIKYNSANTDQLNKIIGSVPKIRMRELIFKLTQKIEHADSYRW